MHVIVIYAYIICFDWSQNLVKDTVEQGCYEILQFLKLSAACKQDFHFAPPGGIQIIVMSTSVCLSICPLA